MESTRNMVIAVPLSLCRPVGLRFPARVVLAPGQTPEIESRMVDSPEALAQYLRENRCVLGGSLDKSLERLCTHEARR